MPKKSVDFQLPPLQAPSNRPSIAFKLLGFKFKQSKAILTPEPGIGLSSTSLLQVGSDTHSQGDIQELLEKTLSKVVTEKASVLKRSQEPMRHPQFSSSSSTTPNTASKRSVTESLSSRVERQKKSTLSASDADGATSHLSVVGESGTGGRPSH